ncbi:LysE family translocator [Aestuariibacter sp. GS-14]|uniref:LysE family translocator n=1 Tax=Aestuariibacter sp. GS-14 TaxID=2590670 RepID=UPI00112D38BA|nr:LysE family translocator [Aestuariibacter sp. GS-14]TPV56507.1 LysE family translocator [Aestuariibacter sp. GS-14]
MITLTFEIVTTFILATLMISLSPGPSNLYILACTLGSGKQGGTAAALGMAVGSSSYAISTAFGLAALILYVPVLFVLIKVLGAGYLIYLGVSALRFAKAPHLRKPVQATTSQIVKRSLLVELSNPKTALFFIAFLPQFTKATGDVLVNDLLVLGLMFSAIALCCDLIVVQLSHQLGKWMARSPTIAVRQEQLVGLIFVGLGLTLVWDLWQAG